MENDVLAEVIKAEKEIQECLETEKKKYIEYIDEVRKKVEEEIAEAEEEFKESFEKEMEDGLRDARQKAAEILEYAARRVELLAGMDDATLRKIVTAHMIKILPEY
jgi:F0F1-type ATP synthase membrane subunit b/b'